MIESAILTFSSVELYSNFMEKATLHTKLPKNFQFFIYFAMPVNLKSLKASFEVSYGNLTEYLLATKTFFTTYENFLVSDGQSVQLLRRELNSACWNTEIKAFNTFSKKSSKWEKNVFEFHENNFKRCRMKIAPLGNLWPEFSSVKKNGKLKPQGFGVELFKIFGTALNFTPEFVPYADKNARIEPYNYYIDYSNTGHSTMAYFHSYLFIMIPPGENYNYYEKLLLPFDQYVWATLGLMALVGIVVIFILNQMSEAVRVFVIGRNNNTPLLNMARIFFGTEQARLPGRNFARFITMLYILFCLIIRTAWQGKMFEFLQKDMTKPQMQSIEEMIEKNFTFYFSESFHNRSKISEMYPG
jgi:hypothetical protein